MTYAYVTPKIRGKTIEFTKNWVIFEFGRIIIKNQKGKTQKLVHKYIFPKVK